MIRALVNGQPRSEISILDRGLSFGDGLFETIAVIDGKPCLWSLHLQRLRSGCQRLRICCPESSGLLEEARMLVGNWSFAVLKIILTRGLSERGYRPPDHAQLTRILQVMPWQGPSSADVDLRICRQRLGFNTLAGIKHLNRLEQVLARAEWDQEADEGVMLDMEGGVVEGCMSNLFFECAGVLHTPLLDRCGVAGVVRETVLKLGRESGQPVEQGRYDLDDLLQSDAVYVTNSLLGIRRVRCLGDVTWVQERRWHPLLMVAKSEVFQ